MYRYREDKKKNRTKSNRRLIVDYYLLVVILLSLISVGILLIAEYNIIMYTYINCEHCDKPHVVLIIFYKFFTYHGVFILNLQKKKLVVLGTHIIIITGNLVCVRENNIVL